jgi:two-component system, OmpR family, sensor kinase
MSIRMRLTLLYSAILALTLLVFGAALYMIQSQSTMSALKQDLSLRSDAFVQGFIRAALYPFESPPQRPAPSGDWLSSDQAFRNLREREIIRVLDASGYLLASPIGGDQAALPLSARGLEVLQAGETIWETAQQDGVHLLIYNRPVLLNGEVVLVIQVAHPLTERDRTLAALSRTLIAAGLLTTLAAFGIGWLLSGLSLRPIHRITQTAEVIGSESDFTRRVDYRGPNDEVGHLARTFNAMLARLQDAYQRVRHALQMQQDFVADVSHELRTPLTTVRGNLALLRREPPLPQEEQADILNDLVDESDRLIRLVNDLLVLARADSQRSLVSEPVQLERVVQETVRQVQQTAREREIGITAEEELCVMGDRDALKQILLILLDNAVKYTAGGIRVSAEANGQRAALTVQDEGPGIPAEVREHIFDRFYRASEDPAVPGFGLGLSIAKALVEAQGGGITVDSEVGKGSRVVVELELCAAQSG